MNVCESDSPRATWIHEEGEMPNCHFYLWRCMFDEALLTGPYCYVSQLGVSAGELF